MRPEATQEEENFERTSRSPRKLIFASENFSLWRLFGSGSKQLRVHGDPGMKKSIMVIDNTEISSRVTLLFNNLRPVPPLAYSGLSAALHCRSWPLYSLISFFVTHIPSVIIVRDRSLLHSSLRVY